MRIYALACAALLAAGPALGQVVIQTPSPDSARHQERAMEKRSDARAASQEARDRAAVGDYEGAADAQREARRDWHRSVQQERRAQQESSTVIIGR
ncbi:MAG: hypothetical protein WDN25_02685 [Acetobacteraceae bacterium]